jgi:hypothetical protein
VKGPVWRSVSSGDNIGPYFFKDEEGQTVTVNNEQYTAILEIFLRNELNLHGFNNVEQLLT